MDSDTLAKLVTAQSQLTAQVQTLEATLAYIAAVESELTSDQLSLEECLALKQFVFDGLPDTSSTRGQLAKLQVALSGLSKVIAANQPPAPVV